MAVLTLAKVAQGDCLVKSHQSTLALFIDTQLHLISRT